MHGFQRCCQRSWKPYARSIVCGCYTLLPRDCTQVHDASEAELIEIGDHAINEWMMDAVTHQPIGRIAARKARGPPGARGVFYWDLNAPALRERGGPPQGAGNLAANYHEWVQGLQANYVDASGRKPAKYLLGSTKRVNIERWEAGRCPYRMRCVDLYRVRGPCTCAA